MRMPPGIPYIVGNEAAERFSYYGMRAILVTFMTQYLMNAQGLPDHMGETDAKVWFHLFVSAVYFLPLLGAIIADAFWGKYRTIMVLSLVYCAGHAALALNDTRAGLFLGLCLIAAGAGGIKPCVSANVGDQFGASNQHLIPRVFSWFYFSINFGSAISTLLIPKILRGQGRFSGPHYAFALPGILMFIATVIFWLGRRKFAHIPPSGGQFFRATFTWENLKIIARLYIIFAFVAVFWALFDQTASSWVLQAGKMDRHWLGVEWTAEQIQAANPIFILILIPIFSYGIYPLVGKVFPLTPLRRIGIGLFVTVFSFLISAWIEARIGQGGHPSIVWQIAAYVVITSGEVLVSITALEFSYTQAPKRLKSLVMAFYLTSVTLGDLFIAGVNKFIENPDGSTKLAGAGYYLFFAAVMAGAAIIFIFVAQRFKTQTFIQDEAPAPV
jgi:proton-dependent oligopeptide transporter, POT family